MKTKTQNLGKVSITVEKDYHSTTKEYDKLTIVEEQGTFKTYISRKPVPTGTLLTNRNYWIPFSGVLESISMDYNSFKAKFIEAENGRVTAEGLRVLAEASRAENEEARILAEIARNAAEGTASDTASSTGTRWARYKYAENSRNNSYSTAEGNSSSTSNDGSRWGAYKKAESDRNSAAETAEGTSSSTANDGTRWGAYKSAENARNTARETVEGSNASTAGDGTRWGAYKTAENNRDTAYLSAEEARDTARETAEGNSNSEAGSNNRWGAYKTAEAARNTARETAEGTASSSAGDGTRWGAYKTAEAARDTARATAEGTSSSTAGDGTRWGSYKTAEANRNSSYSDEEGSSTDTASETGSRWARFNYNEAERDATVAAEVASITGIKTAIMYVECSTSGATATKVVTLDGYTLLVGGSMKIKFTNKNTANNAELRVDGTSTTGTAKPLYYDGARASSTNTWENGETVEVYYDGTNFYANSVAGGGTFATNQKVKEVSISDSLIDDNEDNVLSAKQGKKLNDTKANIDGFYANMGVGGAMNIIKSIPNENTELLRQTGGIGNEVGNGLININAFKGHSDVWNQLAPIKPSDASVTRNGVTIVDNRDGSYTIYTDGNGATANTDLSFFIASSMIIGHTYLIKGAYGGSSSTACLLIATQNVKDTGNGVIWNSTAQRDILVRVLKDTIISENNPLIFKPNIFDLTLIFGAGNEPATVAEFEAWLEQNVGLKPYYAYDAGSILNAKLTGLHNTTQNLLNPTTKKARLITYTYGNNSNKYTIKNVPSGATISFTPDNTGVAETITPDSNGIFTITSVGTLELSAATSNTYLCMTWDNTKDADVVEFAEYTKIFDVTKIYGQLNGAGDYVQVYPNGMLSASSVKDALTKDSAVVNVGSVDLGTMGWTKTTTEVANVTCFMSSLTNASFVNAVCAKYVFAGTARSYLATNDKSFAPYNSGNSKNVILIRDSAYDNTDAPTFKTAMSGVYLNYELATHLTYTNLVYRDNGVDTPLTEKFFPNGIVVGKGGTVEIQPQNTESIVTCAPTLTMKKYVLQAGATLNGADGQVMVEIPEHWRKVYTYLDGAKTMVKAMVSPYPQTTTGWIHVRKGYVSAYEANIDANNKLCSTSDIKDLVLSVVNGKVNATCDVSTIGETGQPADWAAYIAGTHSLFPTTSVTMAAMRTDARARHSIDGDPDTRWNMLVYEQYLALYWLYVIEYANLNSQAAVNVALDYDGFHQGGLGNGVTTVGSTAWNNFNAYKPFVPCGITNCLGNHSGEVILALPSAFGTNIKVSVNSYRGVEMPFGHIWKFADGIKYLGDGTQQAVLRCGNPANYSSASNSDNYTSIGNNVGNDGYKKKIMIGDDGDINCKAVGGGALKAYCDYNYQAHANETYYCSLLGGRASSGTNAGLACVSSNFGLAYASADLGSRLCFIDV